jgi:hypothetical protein
LGVEKSGFTTPLNGARCPKKLREKFGDVSFVVTLGDHPRRPEDVSALSHNDRADDCCRCCGNWCADRIGAATRVRDALAAERRQLPMVRSEKNHVFEDPDGKVSLQPSLSNAWTILGRWRAQTLPAKGGS